MKADGRTSILSAVALIAAAIGLRLYLIPNWPPLNSDEATFGLMARHIMHGTLPIYMYGQNYMGALEAYLGAFFFQFFGVSTDSLRLGMLLLYAVFLAALAGLAWRLYDRTVALVSLLLLVPASAELFERQLTAVGGAMETLVFGSLALLLATSLALSPAGGSASWRRLSLWLGWGLAAGLGLWSHVLVLPWLLFSFALLVGFCLSELRGWAGIALVLGLLAGLAPVILHDLSAGQSSLVTVLSNYRQGGTGATLGGFNLGEQLAGTFLVSLPLATGAGSLCAVSWHDWWPLGPSSTPHTVACTAVHGAWSTGVIAVWLLAAGLILLSVRRMWQGQVAADRQEAAKEMARLAMLAGAGTTVLLYALSPAAVGEPRSSSRYLVGVAIALPALVGALIGPDGRRSRRPAVRWGGWAVLAVLLAVLIGGVQEVMSTERPYALWLNWREGAQVADLLQRGVTRIYTDYWTCDRIAFRSHERIVCAVLDDRLQPGYDRYLPYRDQVRASPGASYLFPNPSPQASILARTLKEGRARYRRVTAYGYVLYQPVRPAPGGS